jgi:hypothetical protein
MPKMPDMPNQGLLTEDLLFSPIVRITYFSVEIKSRDPSRTRINIEVLFSKPSHVNSLVMEFGARKIYFKPFPFRMLQTVDFYRFLTKCCFGNKSALGFSRVCN